MTNSDLDLSDAISNSNKNNAADKSERMEALSKLDNAKFGWFHVRACIVSGIGFFTDAYDLFIINLVMLMMGCVYYKDETGSAKNVVPVYIDTLVKASGQVGTLIGQIVFGILADKLGRKRMYGIELMIIVVATVASTLSANLASGVSVFAILGAWRVILGVGIGGDYPLSAIITSEFATTKWRGAMMAAVVAMQGSGIILAAIVSIALLSMFKEAIYANPDNLDHVWRLAIGVGVIPACCAIYFRLTIPETPRYTMDVDKDVRKAYNDVHIVTGERKRSQFDDRILSDDIAKKESFVDFCRYFAKWKNFKLLLGTTIPWFALDVAFYGLNLNSSIILDAIGFSGSLRDDPWNALFKNAVGNVIIALMGTVPGYWFTVFLIDRMGRKTIQIMGFSILTVLFLVLGFAFNQIKSYSIILFIIIFTVAQFFLNFGPNTTVFIIPGELFPTRYRSTAHGISAAMGKLGAIISQAGFFQLKDIGGKNASIPLIIEIFSGFMFVGLLFTFLVPETKGRTLEELSGEDDNSQTTVTNDTTIEFTRL